MHPLVGRDGERRQLLAVLDAAQRRGQAATVITGEPGIGKTSLLREFLDASILAGWVVLAGGCDPLGTIRPFAPLLEAMASHAATADDAAVAARLLGSPASRVAGPLPILAGLGVRAQVDALIVDAVERACRDAPVVLAVDDVQWADRASLATLASLRRRQTGTLALVLVRRSPAPVIADVSLLLDDVMAGATATIALTPLDRAAVHELAAAAGSAVDVSDLDRAGGNPLYLHTLLDHAADEAPGSIRTLHRLVLRRLEALDADARDVLRVASALGSRFPIDDLAAATGRTVVSLVGPISTLVDGGLLVEVPGGFAFRHEVLREAVYDRLPVPIRSTLHGEIARSLDSIGAERVTVALHVARAAANDPDEVTWLHDTAREIVPTAPELAVELLERVVEMPHADDRDRDRALVDLAEARAWGGDPSGALSALDQVAARGTDRVLLHTAMLMRARLHVIDGTPRAAIEELGLAATHAVSDADRAALLAHEAASRMFLGAVAGVADPARNSLALLDQGVDDPLARSLASIALAGEAGRTARLPEALALAIASSEAARGVDPANQLVPTLFLGLWMLQGGDHDEAEASLRACDELVAGTTLWAAGAVAAVRAVHAFLLGRWDEALVWHERATAPGRAGIVLLDTLTWGVAVQIAARRGMVVEGDRTLARAEQCVLDLTGSSGLIWVMASRVALHEARGEQDDAHRVMANAWDAMRDNDLLVNARLLGPTRVRHAISAGDHAGLRDALEWVGEAAVRAEVEAFRAVADHCRAMAAGDLAAVAAAVARLEQHGLLADAAFAAVDGAWLAGERKDPVGRGLLERAERLIGALGASGSTPVLARARKALGGGRRRSSASDSGHGDLSTLGEREREIVALVAEGLSNQQIADRLLLGKRTIDTYLWRIFRKAGVRNRVELTRLAKH